MKLPSQIKTISGFKIDLIANFAAGGWSALAQIICIPLYIKFLGIEAYGLIGFYVALQVILQVMDFGLTPTINRELARYSVQPEKAGEARDLVRTLEAGYWLIGIAIGAVIWASAPWIALHWIRAGDFPVQNVKQALMIMGLLALFQWPVTFYQGGLMGLGHQVLFNAVRILTVTLTNAGAVLILWLVTRNIQAFFLWAAAVNAAQTIALAVLLWECMPRAARRARFNFGLVRSIWRFAAGMTGITATALILTQADKVILSKLFTLRVFGYYTLAGMFGIGLSMIAASVFNTIFPRFSAMVATGDESAIKALYHRSTQLIAVLVLPPAAVVSFFSTDILQLWTRNADVAHHAGLIAAVLVIGSSLNALMTLPYVLQLAYGWTGLGLWMGVILTVTLVPAIWYMATHYGPVGAASVWAAINGAYMAFGVTLTHRRLLKGEARRWFADVALPLGPILAIALIVRVSVASPMSAPTAIGALISLMVCTMGTAAFVSPAIRPWLINHVMRSKILC